MSWLMLSLPFFCSYGYDPLGLGKDPAQVEKFRAYELIHARWAMLAAAGIVIPEGLQVQHA
jgi:light-harvesting complex II chlorophyll a/b binding protein 5